MKHFFSLLAGAALVNAHHTMQYLWKNGVDQGQNNFIRVPPSNNPVTDVTSTDLTCNVNGMTDGSGVSVLNITAGDTITFEWHQHAQRTGEDPLAGGHHGPILVYIAKVPSSGVQNFNGQGSVWTKIYHNGLVDPSTMWWASDVVNATGGKHSVVIPKALPSGQYLLRAEQIALHVAQSYPGAQFYMGCAQINIAGGGNAVPPTVAIPGAYSPSDPGITVNIYNNLQTYIIPGPAVWDGTSSGSTASAPTATSPTSTGHTTAPGTTAGSTTTASGPTQTQFGQCGGQGWTGPTVCASGFKCVAVSPPYYSQCQ